MSDLYFHSSDISAPAMEAWRALARNIVPSQGPGSGDLKPPGRGDNSLANAQYLRRFQLIVYGAGAPSLPTSVPATQGAVPTTGAPAATARRLPRPGARDSAAPIVLDDLNVTAPAPKPQQPQSQQGIDLSALRCTFYIDKSTNSSPNTLYARIYNMAPATMAKVIQLGRVQISAGYWFSHFGLIFDGTVTQYVRGKENPTDTFLDIYAGDGDKASTATMFEVFPQGSTEAARNKKIAEAQKAVDEALKIQSNPDIDAALTKQVLQRAYVAAGNARDMQRELQLKHNYDQYVDNGTLNIADRGGYQKGEAVVLSPTTGLISIPEVTPEGIQIQCLLNPKLRLAGLVKLDSRLLSGVPYIPGTNVTVDAQGNAIDDSGQQRGGIIPQSARWGTPTIAQFTSAVGVYKIILMKIIGDTRGLQWYCLLSCLAVGSNGQIRVAGPSVLARAGRQVNASISGSKPATQSAIGTTTTDQIVAGGGT